MGAHSFQKLCENFDLPCLHHKSFQLQADKLYSDTNKVRDVVFSKAAELVRKEHAKLNPSVAAPETLMDTRIAVSYDGSWLTRGHTSLIGLGCVIDVLTGLVLDAHVMSSYCQACENKKALQKEHPGKFADWERHHLGLGACDKNFDGTAAMMEVHASKIMWARSIRKHDMRYTIVVSDGDSKAFNAVCEMRPYGPDSVIDKQDCINHVCKRLGTVLRNLVADASKRKITLGGRGAGRLTHNIIRRLSIYFTRAIRRNDTSSEMRDAIMASAYHMFSRDENHNTTYVPKDPLHGVSIMLQRHKMQYQGPIPFFSTHL
ncbi:hypothetical protein ElyMa_003897200 [Elysia marginata]|uniref:Mutator-like transposase domain-containing protein n=1 Tax=Elysia marginata TaxID=1093978 RepID=A0AAV4FMR1_9GAST|nr:hypothetical protein ElyMa_003897200 [Elysia marginata]